MNALEDTILPSTGNQTMILQLPAQKTVTILTELSWLNYQETYVNRTIIRAIKYAVYCADHRLYFHNLKTVIKSYNGKYNQHITNIKQETAINKL